MIRASVKIAGDVEQLQVGDLLVHVGDGTARPVSPSVACKEPFARVLDPVLGERAADGSYRVRCEMLLPRRSRPTAA